MDSIISWAKTGEIDCGSYRKIKGILGSFQKAFVLDFFASNITPMKEQNWVPGGCCEQLF